MGKAKSLPPSPSGVALRAAAGGGRTRHDAAAAIVGSGAQSPPHAVAALQPMGPAGNILRRQHQSAPLRAGHLSAVSDGSYSLAGTAAGRGTGLASPSASLPRRDALAARDAGEQTRNDSDAARRERRSRSRCRRSTAGTGARAGRSAGGGWPAAHRLGVPLPAAPRRWLGTLAGAGVSEAVCRYAAEPTHAPDRVRPVVTTYPGRTFLLRPSGRAAAGLAGRLAAGAVRRSDQARTPRAWWQVVDTPVTWFEDVIPLATRR